MSNTKVKHPLQSRKQGVRTGKSKGPVFRIGQFEALESRQLLSAFQPIDAHFQWGAGRSITQVRFDGSGNCLGASGVEASRHEDCLIGGGTTDPNKIVIGFSGPINKRTFNLSSDVSITGDAGSFRPYRGVVKGSSLTLYMTGDLSEEPGSDLTISLRDISGKRPTAVALDPWSITVHVTASDDDPPGGGCTSDCPPTDTTPPRVLDATPSSGTVLSQAPAFVEARFSEDLQAGTVIANSFRLIGRGPDLAFGTADDRVVTATSVAYSTATDVARFTINGTLPADTYQIRVGGAGTIRDLAGNPFDQDGANPGNDDFIATFTLQGQGGGGTPDLTPPRVNGVTPSQGTVLGQSPAEVAVTFSEDMDAASVTSPSNFLVLRAGGDARFDNGNEVGVVPASITYDAATHTARFRINGTLANDSYQVLLLGSGAMRDRAGNFLDGNGDGVAGGTFASTFQVAAQLETVPPRVLSVSPAANDLRTQPFAAIEARFSEDVIAATVSTANFQVIAAGGDHSFVDGNELSVTPSRIEYDPVTDTARFVLGARLPNDDYLVRLVGTNSIRDLSGNRLDGNGDGTGGDDFTSVFRMAVPLDPDSNPGPQKDPTIGGDPPDLTGDTFGSATPRLDISSISAFHDTINLFVNVRFRAPVSPVGPTISAPSSNEPNSVYGFIDIDADQTLATGLLLDRTPMPISGMPGLGVDYFIDIGSEARHANHVEVFYTGLKLPLAGDIDGDGDDDFVIFRPQTGEFLIGENSAGSFGSVLGPFAFGAVQPLGATTFEQPVLGDWDPDGGPEDRDNDGQIDPGEDRNGNGQLDANLRRADGDEDIGTFDAASGTFRLDLDGNGIRGEDRNGNGTLDPSEDTNNNGALDPGEDIDGDGLLDGDEDVNQNGVLDTELIAFGFAVPSPGDQAVVGDWDGDGSDNIGVYRPATGEFLLDLNGDYMAATATELFVFGPASTTNVAIPGDWNFNGKTDVGVFVRGEDLNGNGLFDVATEDLNNNQAFDNTTGIFFLDRDGDRRFDPDEDRNGNGVLDVGEDTNDEDPATPGTQGNALLNNDGPFSFGLSTDTPIRGSWTTVGRDDIGVQRFVGTESRFFLDLNGDRAISLSDGPFTFGVAGDIPLAGRYGLNGRSSIGTYRGTSLAGNRVTGDQFFIDSNVNRTLSPGEGPFTVVPTAPVEFLSSSFTVKLPLSLVSNDEGFVNFHATTGPFAGFTDEAPNPDSGMIAASGIVTPLQVVGLNFMSSETRSLTTPLTASLPKSTIAIPAGVGTTAVAIGTVGLQVTVAGGDSALTARLDVESIRADTVYLQAAGGDDTFNDGNETLIAARQIVVGSSSPLPGNQLDTIFFDLTGVSLSSDLYRLVVLGDDPVRDPNGIPLDGEFIDRNGNLVITNPEDFPSGNNFPQGDFEATFRLDAPPEIISFRLTRPTDQNVDLPGSTPGDTGVIGDGITNKDSTGCSVVTPEPCLSFVGVVKDDRLPIIGDLPGDTFGTGSNQADIIEASAEFDVNNPCTPQDPTVGCLHIGLRFAQAIGLASSGAPISINGFIDIDADQDVTTGATGFVRDLNGNRVVDFGESIVTIGQAGDVPIIGRWSVTGGSRLGVFRPSTGDFFLDLNGDNSIGTGEGPFASFVTDGIPVVADFNGDGDDEVGVFSQGNWRIDLDGDVGRVTPPSNGLESFFAYGLPGDLPIIGNWNGLGGEEIGVFTPGTLVARPQFRRDLNGNRLADDVVVSFGGTNQPEQIPAIGDWNGDRRTDIGTYSSTLSQWRIDLNGNTVLEGLEGPFIYGDARSTPVIADWDGDLDDDIGTFNTFGPTNTGFAQWFIDVDGGRTLTLGDGPFTFGRVGEDRNGDGVLQSAEDVNNNGVIDPPDQPIVGKWEMAGGTINQIDRFGVFRPTDASHVSALGLTPRADLGLEYFIDLGSESAGVVNLVDARTGAIVQGVTIQLFPDNQTIVIDVPLAAIPETTTGVVTFGAVVGSATQITDQVPERPRAARSAPSIQVDFAAGQLTCTTGADRIFDDGTTFTRGFGTFTLSVPASDPLFETIAGCLPNVVVARATDSFGNVRTLDRGVRVDLTPPQILGVVPPDNSLDRNSPRQIRVQFNDDNLDPRTVETAASYQLICITCPAIDRDQSSKLGAITYNEVDDHVTLTLALDVPSGTYQFTVIGDPGGVTDVAGNRLDGEVNPGARTGQAAAFPTGDSEVDANGNGVLDPAEDLNGNGLFDRRPGGNFTTSLLINVGPPRVLSISGGPGTLIRGVFDLGNEDINGNGLLDGAEDNPEGDPNGNPDGNPPTSCNGVLDPGEDLNNNGVLDYGEDIDRDCKLASGNAPAPPRSIVVTFDQALNPASITTETVFLTRTRTRDQITGLVSRIGDGKFDPFSDRVTGTTVLSDDGKTLVFTPDMRFLDPDGDGEIEGLEPDQYRFTLVGGGELQPAPSGQRENIDVSCDDLTGVVTAGPAVPCSSTNRDPTDAPGFQGTTSIDMFVTNTLDEASRRGPNNVLVIASEDRGQTFNPFDDKLAVYVSNNSGLTWRKDTFFATQDTGGLPGVPDSKEIISRAPGGPVVPFDIATKPSVTFDSIGTAYVAYLLEDIPNVPDVIDAQGGWVADATGDLDIVDVVGTFDGSAYFFEIGFTDEVTPASESLPNALLGRIEIDVDQNGVADCFLDFNSEDFDDELGSRFITLAPYPGGACQPNDQVLIEFRGTRVRMRVAKSLVDFDSNEVANFRAIVNSPGNPQPLSDLAPNCNAFVLRTCAAGAIELATNNQPGWAPILNVAFKSTAVVTTRAPASQGPDPDGPGPLQPMVNGLLPFEPLVPVSIHYHEDRNRNDVLDAEDVDVDQDGVLDISAFTHEAPWITADKVDELPTSISTTQNSNRDLVYVAYVEAGVNFATGLSEARRVFVARSGFTATGTGANRVLLPTYEFNSMDPATLTFRTGGGGFLDYRDVPANDFGFAGQGDRRLAAPRVATGPFGQLYVIWEDFETAGQSIIEFDRGFDTFYPNLLSNQVSPGNNLPFNSPGGVGNPLNPIDFDGVDWNGTDRTVAQTPVNGYSDPLSNSFNESLGFGTRIALCENGRGNCYSIAAQPIRGITANASIAVDRSPGAFSGRIYVAYVGRRNPTDSDGHDDTDIFVTFSDDAGVNWSTYQMAFSPFFPGTPQLVPPGARVNDDLDRASQFNPSISVDPYTGDVYLAWYDTRNSEPDLVRGRAGNTEAELFFAVGRAETAGITFLQNQVVTTRPSDQSLNNPLHFSLGYGDYTGITGAEGFAYPAWADSRRIVVDTTVSPEIDRQISEIFTAKINVQPAFAPPTQTAAVTDTLTEDIGVMVGGVLVGAGNGVLDGNEDVNCNNDLDSGEDVNANGILDLGEDRLHNCVLDLGNPLDGEALNVTVTNDPVGLPSGDGDPGGNFVAGFVISDRFIFADSAFEEDPLFQSDGSPNNPFPTLQRAVDQTNLIEFHLTFMTPVALPSAPTSNPNPRIVGFIDLDADQNTETPLIDFNGDGLLDSNYLLSNVNRLLCPNPATGCSSSGLGTDFFVDLGSEKRHPGTAEIINSATRRSVGRANVSLVGDDPNIPDTLIVQVPRNNIRILDLIPDFVNYSIVVGADSSGNGVLESGEANDRAPNQFERPTSDHFRDSQEVVGDTIVDPAGPDIARVLVDFAPTQPQMVRARDGRTPGGQPIPYVVEPAPGGLNGTILVGGLANIELDPGVVVKMRAANLDFAGAGANLFARGTLTRPVIFTSLFNDDLTVGGDTNGDADNTTPRRGDWGGLVFRTGTDDALSLLSFTRIGFGGGVVPRGGEDGFDPDADIRPESITMKSARPTIVNSVIERSGLPLAGFLENAQAAMSATPDSFQDDTFMPADGTSAGQRGPLIRNIEFESNSINGLLVHASHDTGETAFSSFTTARMDDPVVHVLTTLMRVTAGTSLTIDPGMVVKNRFGAIAVDGRGTLLVGADGPNDARVIFTSIFDDSDGRDTNDDGFAGIDSDAVVPGPGDWGAIFALEPAIRLNLAVAEPGLEQRVLGGTGPTLVIDEADIRFAGGQYVDNATPSLGLVRPALSLESPGYFQVTNTNFFRNGRSDTPTVESPFRVFANVLRPDVPFDIPGTLADESRLNEDPLIRGNTFVGNEVNAMEVDPIEPQLPSEAEVSIITPDIPRLLNRSFVDVDGDGRLELTDGIDGHWNDTDIVHFVRETIGFPGRVETPNAFNFGVLPGLPEERFREQLLFAGGVDRRQVREIDFETDAFGAPFGANEPVNTEIYNVAPFNVSIVPQVAGSLRIEGNGPNLNAVLGKTLSTAGCFITPELPFGPTSGTNVLTTTGALGSDGMNIVFHEDVFAVGFNIVQSNFSDLDERIEVLIRDPNGIVSTYQQFFVTSGFFGVYSAFPIVEVRIFEEPGDEFEPDEIPPLADSLTTCGVPPAAYQLLFDDVAIDDLIYSLSPVNPIVATPTQPSALLTLESLPQGTVLRTPFNETFETMPEGESLIVKLTGAAPAVDATSPAGAWSGHDSQNRAFVGAGFVLGLDDGIDCGLHTEPSPCQSNATSDWGLGSALRILGVPGRESTGQSRIPVILTSVRDDREGPKGQPHDTNNDGFIPLTGSLQGVGNAPAAGDWGDIFIGARSRGDRDDLLVPDFQGVLRTDPQAIPGRAFTPDDPQTVEREDLIPAFMDETQGSVIMDADIKYLAKIRLQGASLLSQPLATFTTTGAIALSFGQQAFNGEVVFPPGTVNADPTLCAAGLIECEAKNGSIVIAHNNIFNMRDAAVVAHPGYFPVADTDHDDFNWIPAEPWIYNNVIAFVPQLNGVPRGTAGANGVQIRGSNDDATNSCANFPSTNGRDGVSSVVMHNTFFGLATGVSLGPDAAALAINNIISDSTTDSLEIVIRTTPGGCSPADAATETQAGFNLFFNAVGAMAGQNNVNGNPRFSGTSLFMDTASGDFRLLPFSASEDRNNNGVLDPGEDLNGDGQLNRGGDPNPAIDVALGEYAPATHWTTTIDDSIIRLPLPPTVFNTSPLGPEKDIFGSVRQDDTRVPNPPPQIGGGAEVFFDFGAIESRDFGAPGIIDAQIVLGTSTVRMTPNTAQFVSPQVGEIPESIRITLTEDLQLGTVTKQSVQLLPSGGDGSFQGNEQPVDVLLAFDAPTNVLTITPSRPLDEDLYRLIVRGSGGNAVTDLDGIRIDGEFPGGQPNTSAQTGYPTGDGIPGGDFVSQFRVGIAPRVRAVTVTDSRSQPPVVIGPPRGVDADFLPDFPEFRVPIPPNSIRIDFTEQVILTALTSISVVAYGPDGQFGTTDDQTISGRTVPGPGMLTDTVEFQPTVQGTLPTDTIWRLVLSGTPGNAITDAVGILLDGEFISGNEDSNRNGVIDPQEDRNGNGLLDTGPDIVPSGDGAAGGNFIGYFQVGDIDVVSGDTAIIVDSGFRGSPGCTQNGQPIENGTQACPFNTIQQAIDTAANLTTPTKVVEVLRGTYYENVLFEARHSGITLRSRDGDLATVIEVLAGQSNADGVPVDPLLPALTIAGALDVTVEGFSITTNGRTGVRIDLADGAASVNPVVLSRNTIFGNQTGVLATLGAGRRPRLENNVVWANSGPGIEIRGRTGDSDAEVVNNTVVFNQEGIVVRATSVGSPNIAHLFNNIVVGSNGAGIRSVNTAGATIDFNDVFQNLGGNYVNVIRLGTHNISADPLFRQPQQRPASGRPDPRSADWRLGSQSPAIDAGLGDEDVNNNGQLDPTEDFNANGRRDFAPSLDHESDTRFDDPFIPAFGPPNTGKGRPDFVDIGAFERQSDSSGPPGSLVRSSVAVRALDLVLDDGDVLDTSNDSELALSREQEARADTLDDLLAGWMGKRRLRKFGR